MHLHTDHDDNVAGANASDINTNADMTGVDEVTESAFALFQSRLASIMGDEAWRSWGDGLRIGAANARQVRLYAPTALHCSRLHGAIGERRLRATWEASDAAARRLVIAPDPRGSGAAFTAPSPAKRVKDRTASCGTAAGDQRSDAVARTFDNFVPGAANRVAHACARAVAGQDEPPFRLALIYGTFGAGKSHLLRAVEAEANSTAGGGRARALYFSHDRFRADYVKALHTRAGLEFKERLRAADILIIDDVHLLGSAPKTQAELHSAVSEMLSEGGRVLLAADRPADELTELEDGLRARLAGGVSCVLERPDLDLRRDILSAIAADNTYVRQGLEIPAEVLDFIASAVVAMPRDLEAALNTLISRTAMIGVPITRETAREALASTLNAANRRVTVEDIQKAVAAYHGMRVSDLLSKRRTRDIVRPRQQAMFLAKEFTSRSLPDIARRFGGMDHTTVMHAVKRVKSLVRDDMTVRGDIEALRRILQQGPSARGR